MKIEKLPSGSYRVRKTYEKKTYTLIFDYKPTQKEIIDAFSAKIQEIGSIKGTFDYYAKDYIKSRSNILSPSSVLTYEKLIKAMSDDFKGKRMGNITQADVQKEINRYAETHAPKTVRSLHGFIATVIGAYRPQMVLKTTLPQKIIKENYLPTDEDIKAILNAAKGTEDSIGFQLGVLSLRRSEICALTMDDLTGNELHIHRNLVYYKKWMVKETPKTDAGNRTIYLPDSLVEEIHDKGYFFKYSPNKLLEHLNKCQDRLGIPRFRFHDLRHYFASYASTIMPESDAMALGGWKSDYVFKQVYRESMKDKRKASAEMLNHVLFGESCHGNNIKNDTQ